MRAFSKWILRHKALVLIFFAAGVIICAFCQRQVTINYEFSDYLPADTASTVAINRMGEEFAADVPNARVMVPDVTIPEALEYKDALKQIEGVTAVTWLDDAADITQPLEVIGADTVESYYRDDAALFSVTIAEDCLVDTVHAIRSLIGETGAMSGAAIDTAVATEDTMTEVARIVAIAVPFCFLILLLTTKSWFAPVLMLGSIGVAVILNAGSNLIFGTISFVTSAAGNILQLAVSLDYSVFLLHRFREIREKEQLPPADAMAEAMCRSVTSILSSGLTTVIGFAALILMRFGIGPDMGMALAKGIAFSLLTTFTLLPVLTVLCTPLIDRTAHQALLPPFHKFARVIRRVTVPMVIVFVILLVPSYLAQLNNTFSYGASDIFGPETTLGRDTETIEDAFGKSNSWVLMVPRGDTAREQQLSQALHELPEVTSILSYVDLVGAEIPTEYLDADTLSQLMSENYSRMILTVRADTEGENTMALVEQVRTIAASYYPEESHLVGTSVSTYDLKETITSDSLRVNLIAIGAVFVVLLLSFRSLLLAGILVLAIELAIWLNLAIPYFTGQSLYYIAYLIISSVQLGATVDYAILITSRYLEERPLRSKWDAMHHTVSSSAISILTSGIILTAMGFLLGFMTTHGLLSQFGFLLGRGTLFSLGSVFLVLPGLLVLLDRPIEITTRGVRFYRQPNP